MCSLQHYNLLICHCSQCFCCIVHTCVPHLWPTPSLPPSPAHVSSFPIHHPPFNMRPLFSCTPSPSMPPPSHLLVRRHKAPHNVWRDQKVAAVLMHPPPVRTHPLYAGIKPPRMCGATSTRPLSSCALPPSSTPRPRPAAWIALMRRRHAPAWNPSSGWLPSGPAGLGSCGKWRGGRRGGCWRRRHTWGAPCRGCCPGRY